MTSSFSYAGTGSPLDSLYAAGSEKKTMLLGVLPGTGLNDAEQRRKRNRMSHRQRRSVLKESYVLMKSRQLWTLPSGHRRSIA